MGASNQKAAKAPAMLATVSEQIDQPPTLLSTEFPGVPPRGGDAQTLLSTEFPGVPPRPAGHELAGGGGDEVSLMSTEFPGVAPRPAGHELAGGGGDEVSLLSTEFPGVAPRPAGHELAGGGGDLQSEASLSEVAALPALGGGGGDGESELFLNGDAKSVISNIGDLETYLPDKDFVAQREAFWAARA